MRVSKAWFQCGVLTYALRTARRAPRPASEPRAHTQAADSASAGGAELSADLMGGHTLACDACALSARLACARVCVSGQSVVCVVCIGALSVLRCVRLSGAFTATQSVSTQTGLALTAVLFVKVHPTMYIGMCALCA